MLIALAVIRRGSRDVDDGNLVGGDLRHRESYDAGLRLVLQRQVGLMLRAGQANARCLGSPRQLQRHGEVADRPVVAVVHQMDQPPAGLLGQFGA